MNSARVEPLLTVAIAVWCFTLTVSPQRATAEEITTPKVLDPNLKLSLVASEPQVVTPTGLAADRDGRLYVVQSHTHSRGRDYAGPASDRIVVFSDTNNDGRIERSHVFADGLRQVLTIAFAADGALYAVQMKSVVALRDTDGDGQCDARQDVISIETENNNHHGVFLGLAFDNENRLFVSLGNIGGSAYVIQGADGSRLAGQGDTGLIVRCSADGSSLEKFAAGFWNPPDLRFDTAGRLLATDNDPDARGPNRVLHIIEGGDYGYKSRFGGSGLHPYCAWNGELPATLPMIAGVGEAPVGLLDGATTSLPEDYAHDLLVSVWGTNEIVRVKTMANGASLTGEVEPVVVGDELFRPTGIVATTDGAVYIADWADRRYPVHGKGRLWRLTAKQGVKTLMPQAPFSRANNDSGEAQLRKLQNADSPEEFESLLAAALQSDPFAASTALKSLKRTVFRPRVEQLLDDNNAQRRLIALLTLRKANVALDAARLGKLLNDENPLVRKMAMIWIGETVRVELAADLQASLPLQTESADLFEAFLATSQLLTADELQHVQEKTPGSRIDRRVDQQLVQSILADEQQPDRVRAMAVRFLSAVDDAQIVNVLLRCARSKNAQLAIEAIRTLATYRRELTGETLQAIAVDENNDVAVRCEAVMALAASDEAAAETLLPLIADKDAQVALTAARAMTRFSQTPQVEKAFSQALAGKSSNIFSAQVAEQLRFALRHSDTDRPQTDQQWMSALNRNGNAAAGRRVFFDARTNCAKCHRVEGRGGRVGPELTNIASAKSRSQILSSILNPSADKSPDYQGYIVALQDGRIFKGTQFHYRGESAELLLEDGSQLRFKLSDAEEYRPLDESLMPDKLEDAMSVDEFRDLLAFLETLQTSPQSAVD